jgi:hypothetical protein
MWGEKRKHLRAMKRKEELYPRARNFGDFLNKRM